MDSTIIWSILCCALFLSSTEAEVFTAISDIEPLLETHKLIIHNIDDYLNKEENRINILKQHLNHYKNEHKKAMEDIPNYLGNPINAFTLIKRLSTDLIYLERRIEMGTEYINNVSISQPDQKYPEDEDLMGAAWALSRLQRIYYLNVEDLSEGILNGVTYSTSMTASDCFEVGRALFNQKDFTNAIAWMKASLRKFHENNLDYPVEETDILEYISYSYYEQGDGKKALEWTDKLLQLEPDHVRAKDKISYYKKIIADTEEKLKRKKRGETDDDDGEDTKKKYMYAQELKSYETLCRGETDVPKEIAQRLKCYYLTENHPFLRLAPIKAEQVYINPDILVFHQVISDDEIEFVQNAAKPRFKRAEVHDAKTGKQVVAHYRISKSAWLRDEESPVIAKISQRVADMTGLEIWSAEKLQVSNYGIGGHYIPHYDFALKNNMTFDLATDHGNRIATVLFYETDDDDGEDTKKKYMYAQELKSYETLCRGETDVPKEIAQRLKCYYLTENHPFLRLAPIKAEQVYINPDILVFHQVISDDEIEFVQNAAKPRFKRAEVHDAKTGKQVVAHYRISKSAWLRDEESPVIAKISQRVADMTGLEIWSAEKLQVSNYGIGGHYIPHYDFALKNNMTFDLATDHGNRIATVLFYMSEVSQGGATVFTRLGLSVVPIKNAAVFWMNLHPSGEGDLDTRHAACPVLRGSKWVCNKWLHQGGQELIKPCNLEYQQENTVRKIPRTVPKSLR